MPPPLSSVPCDSRTDELGGDPIPPPNLEAGYRLLLEFSREDFVAIHDAVAAIGRTWDAGVREPGTVDYVGDRILTGARVRLAPSRIAAEAMVLVVREHPFWDGNHRTGFQVADSILRAFGRRIVVGPDEAERMVRGIDARGVDISEIREWIARHIRKRR